MSTVEALLAECQRVSDAIAGHREAISDLTAERDGMVAELRRLGLSERAVGRLLGISGPRVNQIMAGTVPVTVVTDERVPEGAAVVVSGTEAAVVPVAAPRKRAAAAPRTVTAAAPGVPPTAFQEPAEPERGAAQCPPHPKGRVTKKFCGACGRPVGDEAVR